MASVPNVKFNNGFECPIIGLGTWKASPGEVTQAVKDAIDIGYRHFDCAYLYQNEHEVGIGILDKIKEGVVKREDLFITSKLWNTKHERSKVVPAIEESLKNFGLDYLDLYLIHWPFALKDIPGNLWATDKDGNFIPSDESFLDTWKGMEECVDKGLTKSIGLSNFNSKQIDAVLDVADIKPVNNQVECHPYLNQKKLMDFCSSKGLTLTAYSPLGRPAENNKMQVLDDPVLKSMGEKLNRSVAQLCLKYLAQRNIIVVPKSVRKERLKENFNLFDFTLTDAEMAQIDGINRDLRLVPWDALADHKDYPFKEEF